MAGPSRRPQGDFAAKAARRPAASGKARIAPGGAGGGGSEADESQFVKFA
jgi:hypothetical protein